MAVPIRKQRPSPLALHAAVVAGHLGEVKQLLEAGADPRLKGPDGRRPIHLAVATGNGPITEALLSTGAHSTDRDSSGWTAMHYALTIEDYRLLGLLLEAAEGPWLAKGRSWSLLHVAAERGDERAMQLLLAALGKSLKRRVDVRDLHGRTPLHVAAEKNAAKVASVLLEHGADPRARTDEGASVAALAESHSSSAVARQLARHLPVRRSSTPKQHIGRKKKR